MSNGKKKYHVNLVGGQIPVGKKRKKVIKAKSRKGGQVGQSKARISARSTR